MAQNKTWSVVKFSDENTVEAVPTNWLVGNKCYWPPYTREKVINSIRNYDEPNTCWPRHTITIFRDGTFDSYLEARGKLKVAEYSSDLNDEDLRSRKYRKKKGFLSSSEESENDKEYSRLPPPPPLSRKKISNTSHSLVDNQQTNYEPNGKSHPSRPTIESSEYPTTSAINEDKDEKCNCCPIHKNGINQFGDESMKKLMKQYYFIGNVLTDINKRLENLNIGEPTSTVGSSISSIFNKFSFFPIGNLADLQIFEEYLGESSNFRAAATEISKTGGGNTYDLMKRCLSRLISNSLASQFSFHGRKIKKSFKDLKIADLLICAAQQADDKIVKKDIEDAIMKWLRRASERK